MVFQFDCRTPQLEVFTAAVEMLKGKGSCCYEGTGEFAFLAEPNGGSDGSDVTAEASEAEGPRAGGAVAKAAEAAAAGILGELPAVGP